ncbi:MAG: 5-deoxy-glucuronate isomerase [Actinomycetia bacterium]|nr:5-deoxy-glucuronate isomerase [Actinomycetes bacterium]
MSELVIRRGTGTVLTDIDPRSRTGWSWTGLTVVELDDQPYPVGSQGREYVVVPLAAPGWTLRTAAGEQRLTGRASVFEPLGDCAYIGAGQQVEVTGPGRLAIASAPTEEQYPVAVIRPEQVAVAARGAGTMSRLVRGITLGSGFTGFARVLVCEVVTPGGNWSSYPAHKHDQHTETERELEEIYYYELSDGPGGQPGFGYHQTTSTDPARPVDILTEVRSGDTVLVPYGWHGPCTAAPGHDMYYLNVMAGPATDRQWLITDHPEQTWVRDLWPGLALDPRIEEKLR